jgi:hypothetical protein
MGAAKQRLQRLNRQALYSRILHYTKRRADNKLQWSPSSKAVDPRTFNHFKKRAYGSFLGHQDEEGGTPAEDEGNIKFLPELSTTTFERIIHAR